MARGPAKRRLKEKRSKRERLAEAQGWRCCYCGVTLLRDVHEQHPMLMRFGRHGLRPKVRRALLVTIDHVWPKALGGNRDWPNIVAACSACNGLKGSLPPSIALGIIEAAIRSGTHPLKRWGII